MTNPPLYPGPPRWVKTSGIVVGVLVMLFLVVMFTGIGGPHGPGRHQSGDTNGQNSGVQQP